ncbi:MAG: cell division protein FtsA [Candidatus Omnitrophota bacterium]
MTIWNDGNHILAIDIGSTKVCAIAARRNERKVIELLGLGLQSCNGFSATGIVDLEEIVASISSACRKALSHVPGVEIRCAAVGVSGTFIQSQNTTGSVVLSRHGRTVNQRDIEQSLQAAIERSVPKDYEVIHPVPRWFRLDETPYIRDPLGMEGSVLEVDVHLITGRQTILKNLKRCVQKAGFLVESIACQPIASSLSVLTQEEKDTGVALIDIGGSTTSVLVFYEGGILHSEIINVGGEDITRDINHYFQTPVDNAENLKKYSGSAWSEAIDPDELLEIVRFKNRRTIVVKRRRLCEVIEARVEQILEEVIRSLRARDLLGVLFGGIVLTGGASLMDGMREKTQSLAQKEAHIGYPNGVVGYEEIVSSPGYSAAVGLLHYAFDRRDARIAVYGTGMKRVMRRLFQWIQETF